MNANTTSPTPEPGRAQLELTLATPYRPAPRPNLPTPPHPRPSRPPTRRFTVSRWWFARMREAVQTAQEWPVAEQPDLALTLPPTRFTPRGELQPLAA